MTEHEDPRPALKLLAIVIGAFVLFFAVVHAYWFYLSMDG